MHLALFSLLVRDYDEAIAFFVGAVGFQLVEDSPSVANDGTPKRWVVIGPADCETGILLAEARGDEQLAAVGRQFGGRVGLFLQVDDFDDQHTQMMAAGVEFTQEPRDEPYGRFAVWRDLCGNLWDLIGPATTQSS